MYRIREDFGKKTAEEIREGSVVKRAEDDSLYKFIGVAKNTSSCEYEAVLMALSGDYGLYTVPVKDFLKAADFGSHQSYAYETCVNVDGTWSVVYLSLHHPLKSAGLCPNEKPFGASFLCTKKGASTGS